MSGLPPSPPSRTAPIPISSASASTGGPNSTSHHVRSLSFSFGTNTGAAPSTSPSSTYSPITPSPILAGIPSSASAAKASFFSTSPRAPFSKDWASSWASGGIGGGAGGSAVAEDDEDGGPLSMSSSLGAGGSAAGPGVTRSLGWGGAVVAGGPGNGQAVVKGGPATGTRTIVQSSEGSHKINGVLRRLSLGGGGLMRPNMQAPQPTPPTPLPTPQAPAGSFFPPSVTAVPDLVPDRPAPQEVKLRGRKPSVGGKGKRSISPTGERMLQGHHGGLF